MALIRTNKATGGLDIPAGYFIGVTGNAGAIATGHESISGSGINVVSIAVSCKGYSTLSGTIGGLVSKINSDGTLATLGNTADGPVDVSNVDMAFISGQIGNVAFTYSLA